MATRTWNSKFSARATVPLRGFGAFADLAIDDLLRPVDREDIRHR
jgi:hypothetical protein